MRGLKDKIVLVTGGTRGIGRGIAKRFLEEGAEVVIVGRGEEDAEKAVKALRPLGPVTAYLSDVGIPENAEKAVNDVIAEKGRIDILVNVAGIYF